MMYVDASGLPVSLGTSKTREKRKVFELSEAERILEERQIILSKAESKNKAQHISLSSISSDVTGKSKAWKEEQMCHNSRSYLRGLTHTIVTGIISMCSYIYTSTAHGRKHV